MDPYYPFKNGSVEDFTIGTEDCNNKIGYCNGPLKSGSTYRVKVRAFTASDKFTDTSYSFPIQTGVYTFLSTLISSSHSSNEFIHTRHTCLLKDCSSQVINIPILQILVYHSSERSFQLSVLIEKFFQQTKTTQLL